MLEDVTPDEIVSAEPLFGEGLGLDSIDALELAIALENRFGVTIEEDSEQNAAIFASVREPREPSSTRIARPERLRHSRVPRPARSSCRTPGPMCLARPRSSDHAERSHCVCEARSPVRATASRASTDERAGASRDGSRSSGWPRRWPSTAWWRLGTGNAAGAASAGAAPTGAHGASSPSVAGGSCGSFDSEWRSSRPRRSPSRSRSSTSAATRVAAFACRVTSMGDDALVRDGSPQCGDLSARRVG